MFGEPRSRQDIEFDAVIAAVARRNVRQNVAHRKGEDTYVNPLHKKAVERRRKRKRGGPK